MTMSTASAGTRRSQRRIFAVLNPFMRFMLRLPLRGMRAPLVLLSFTGRKTGHPFEIPASFAMDADGSLLVPGGGAWKWNLGHGRRLDVRYRGEWREASSEIVDDVNELRRLVPRLIADNQRAESFIGVPVSAAGVPDEARLLEVVREGFVILRLRLGGRADANAHRTTLETILRVVLDIGALGLTLLGLWVWATESVYVVSVYWLLALIMGVGLLMAALVAVVRGRARLGALGGAMLAVVPVIVSVTPVWWMYPLAGLALVFAIERSLRHNLREGSRS